MKTKQPIAIAVFLGLAIVAVSMARSDKPEEKPPRIGVVKTSLICNQMLLENEKYKEALKDEYKELSDRVSAKQAEFDKVIAGLKEKAEAAGSDGPRQRQIQNEYNQVKVDYENYKQRAKLEKAALDARLIKSIHKDFLEAVNVVAERHGVDYVLMSPEQKEPEFEELESLIKRVTAQVVLRSPEKADMTGDVLDELGLKR